MADLKSCRKLHFNEAQYLDKVLGCWTGKNIGGTLGAPFEGRREMQNISFYAQELNGAPAPNDDLDLQLVWLEIAELYGVMNLNCRHFGDAWLGHIVAGWNEYGVPRHVDGITLTAGQSLYLVGIAGSPNPTFQYTTDATVQGAFRVRIAYNNAGSLVQCQYGDIHTAALQ